MNKAFYRKVAYCAAIAVLLLPLSWLGQPPAGVQGEEGQGGKLAQLRQEYDLSQAELGEIDPASETMRLATLGLNGVAANILWYKAIDYQKRKDWSNFMATVNQIIKIQPNFVRVWEFQSHNISYNTSVEFDDYRYRYAWVKRGVEFLIDGVRYNRDEPRLLSYTGHFIGQKVGRADEAKQFRRMFATDRDFHAELGRLVKIDDAIGQSGFPDNWLVSRLWYLRAQAAVDAGRPLRGQSELIFHSNPPKARINYAIFNEKDGFHGERARRDWATALREWSEEYGSRSIPTSWGHTLRLNERENLLANAELLKRELEQLAGVTFQQVEEEKRAKLSPDARVALETPEDQRTPEQHGLYYESFYKIRVAPQEVAERATGDRRAAADRIAAVIADRLQLAERIDQYRQTVNYEYWKTRCEVEMTELADQARQLVHDADELYAAAQLTEAKAKYEEAWQAWAKIFERYPSLMDDLMAEELVGDEMLRMADRGPIRKYIDVLNQLDEKLPDDFILADVLARYDERYRQEREARSQTNPPSTSTEAPSQPATSPSVDSKPEPQAERSPPPRPPTPPEEDQSTADPTSS